MRAHENHCCRIVLTGGPGGGKTTAAVLFRREIGESVVVVPEAATLLFSGGFPRSRQRATILAAQRAIFHVQRNLEETQAALFPNRILLCDRGTVDGAAYWPGEPHHFFNALGTTLDHELERYDAVIFFETAAAGDLKIEGGNPVRRESNAEAVTLDRKLRALWLKHPRFVLVPHNRSFFKKISSVSPSWTASCRNSPKESGPAKSQKCVASSALRHQQCAVSPASQPRRDADTRRRTQKTAPRGRRRGERRG